MALKFVVLTLLNRQPKTGYEIVKTFDSSVGYFWHATHQQVYRELGKLADEGLVRFTLKKQSDKPDKKVYRISNTGKKELMAWLEKPLKPTGYKDPLLVKLLSAGQVDKKILIRELHREAGEVETTLNTFLEIERTYYSKAAVEKMPLADISVYLALRKGILIATAEHKWFEDALAVLHTSKQT